MTWHAKKIGRFSHMSIEATDNAQEVCKILIDDYGWTLEAAAGAIGNMFFESGLNPWSWEGTLTTDNSLTQSYARTITHEQGAKVHGYGLIGWTPARKYQFNNAVWNGVVLFPNYDQEHYRGYGPYWSDVPGKQTDGAAQVKLLAEAMSKSSGNIWINHPGHVGPRDYITLTDVEEAASEFWYGAENSSGSGSIPQRQEWARDYYDWLTEHGYEPSGSDLDLILLIKTAQKNVTRGF